jgi:hypothetical protein
VQIHRERERERETVCVHRLVQKWDFRPIDGTLHTPLMGTGPVLIRDAREPWIVMHHVDEHVTQLKPVEREKER